jgi:hypothetical protein
MNGRKTALGGFAFCVTSNETVGETVGIPLFSNARWTSAMLWWQMGQAGAASAMSAPSSETAVAMSSASVRSRRSGSML